MIQHFYCAPFKNVLLVVFYHDFIQLPFFSAFGSKPWVEFQSIKCVNIDSPADFKSFFVKILWIFIGFVERFQEIDVNYRWIFLISEADEFVIGELISQAEFVKHKKVDFLAGEFWEFDGFSGQGATWYTTQGSNEVIAEFVNSAEQVGMFSEYQVEVLFEFYSFFSLDASVEKQFEEYHFLLVFGNFFHFDYPFVKRVNEPQKWVQLLWPKEYFIFTWFLR